MKTTVELAPALLELVKKRAADEGLTFKAFLETTLWAAVKAVPKKKRRKMKDLRCDGKPAPGYEPSNWDQTRAIIYEGHGG